MSKRREDLGDPTRHTAVIGDVSTMWQKLAWDIQVFDDIQRDAPQEREPLGFAAVNVCIAASSLRNWTETAFAQRRRREGKSYDRAEFLT